MILQAPPQFRVICLRTEDADAVDVDKISASLCSPSQSSPSSVVSATALPSSYGAPDKSSAGIMDNAEAKAKTSGATGTKEARLPRPGAPPFVFAAESRAEGGDCLAAAAGASATVAPTENPFAFQARSRLLRPHTLLHPPGVSSSSSAAPSVGSGGEETGGSSRRRFCSFSSGRHCSSGSGNVTSPCTPFTNKPETSGTSFLSPPVPLPPVPCGTTTTQSPTTDNSSCTTTCSSSETEGSRSTLRGSPALSFSMPATPRLHVHHAPGIRTASMLSPFNVAAGASAIPASGDQTGSDFSKFSLPRAYLSESAAAPAWPAKRRRSIHVDGSGTGMLLPEQHMQQRFSQAVFAAGRFPQPQTTKSCNSAVELRDGVGNGCNNNTDSGSTSMKGFLKTPQIKLRPEEDGVPSVAIIDADVPAALSFRLGASAGEDSFGRAAAAPYPAESAGEIGAINTEVIEREGCQSRGRTSSLQSTEEELHVEEDTTATSCGVAPVSLHTENNSSSCFSSGRRPPANGSLPTLHATTASSASPSEAASNGETTAVEGNRPQRLEFLDSGCYSLCYHTAMAVVPYSALTTDSSVAQLLQQQQALLLDRDREARRRRKACLSVLRSVENALVGSPGAELQQPSAARRYTSPASSCSSAARPTSHATHNVPEATTVSRSSAASLSSTCRAQLQSIDDVACFSPSGDSAATPALPQHQGYNAQTVAATDTRAHSAVEAAAATPTSTADLCAAAGKTPSLFTAPLPSPLFSSPSPPSSHFQLPRATLQNFSSLCTGKESQQWQLWENAKEANFLRRHSAMSADTAVTTVPDRASAASSPALAAADTIPCGSNGEATAPEQEGCMEGAFSPGETCFWQQKQMSPFPALRSPAEHDSEKHLQQQQDSETAGGALTASNCSTAQLRLRPEWLSPFTLSTLVGACVHCYDVLRAAYPPPEPPPRLCLVSLPALYTQLPPHLLAGAVLLDEAALTLGCPPHCIPIECSLIPAAISSDNSSSSGNDNSLALRTENPQRDAEAQKLPGNLLGEFDIIVCETRSVTLARIENIAACVKALSRRRRKKRTAVKKRVTPASSAGAAKLLLRRGASRVAGGDGAVAGCPQGGTKEVHMQSSTSESEEETEGDVGEDEEEINVAAAALGCLALSKPEEDATLTAAEKLLRQQLRHQLQQEETSKCLPASVRVIMLSTCLLSAVIDDLLGLKQSRFQPYVPSSALSSLQLQCIYTNFDDYPRFQKHNDVDFATRVRATRRVAHRTSSSRRVHGVEGEGYTSGQNRSAISSSSGNNEGGTAGEKQRAGDVALLDHLISRAMVLQAEEEARAAAHPGEGDGTTGLHFTTKEESSSEESAAEEPDSAAEVVTGMRQRELRKELREPCQRTAEATLLDAFDALQLQSGTAAAAAMPSEQQQLREQGGRAECSAVSTFTCGRDDVEQSAKHDQSRLGTGTPIPKDHRNRLESESFQTVGTKAGTCTETMRSQQRAKPCRGITMRQDDDEDDGIDYDLECGSHFGMVPHEL